MYALDISYFSKDSKVTGPSRVAKRTTNDLFEWVREATAEAAVGFLKEQQDDGFFPKKDFLRLVDNKLGRDVKQVKTFGKVEYVTKLGDIPAAILGIFQLVVERSATRTGYYQSMNVLFYNGKMVGKNYFDVSAWLKADRDYKDTDRFRIVNLSPYARKLERRGVRRGAVGKGAGIKTRSSRKTKSRSGNLVAAPNGTYWFAKNVARRKFVQLKDNIKFSFIPIAPSVAASANRKTFKPNDFKFSKGKGKGRPYLYPSITISLGGGSFGANAGFTESGGKL